MNIGFLRDKWLWLENINDLGFMLDKSIPLRIERLLLYYDHWFGKKLPKSFNTSHASLSNTIKQDLRSLPI